MCIVRRRHLQEVKSKIDLQFILRISATIFTWLETLISKISKNQAKSDDTYLIRVGMYYVGTWVKNSPRTFVVMCE